MYKRSLFFVFALVVDCARSCTTPLGVQSQCVNIYSCPQLASALVKKPVPSNVIDFLRQSACGFDGNTPMVCCGPLPSSNTENQNIAVDPAVSEDSYPAPTGRCGEDTGADKIYSGVATDIDEFRWMALLGYRKSDGTITYQCGGVLINQRYVLTAAHCVKGAIETEVGQLVTVRLGEYDTRTTRDCVDNICVTEPHQDIPVAGAYPNAGYDDANKNKKDDIAIVRLAKRAQLNAFVQPICLADNSARLLPGSSVVVAGWGKTLNGRNSPVKQKLNMAVYDKDQCITKYRKFGAELTPGQFCAGGEFAKDACRGDSGGPLMAQRSTGDWEAIGIVSFGYGCGRDGWPGVYTSVIRYTDWINNILQATNV